jgi:DNA-binding NarL/FixJ family response regulator
MFRAAVTPWAPMTGHDAVPPAEAAVGALRVLIADDDRFMRTALAAGLAGDFAVVGTAADADEAIALAEELHPDAAILDVDMPGGGGLRATTEILQRSPTTAVVILSGDESDVVVRDMINAGAMTYVRKGAQREELAEAVRRSVAATRPAS